MFRQRPDLGQSMTEWSTALQQSGQSAIADQIDEPKLVSLQRLEASGLPCHYSVVTPVPDFLQNPAAAFQELDQPRYFAILTPRTEAGEQSALRRYRQGRLRERGVLRFVENTLAETERESYDLILQGAFRHLYGGNIICGSDGSVELEMARGQNGHNALVASQVNPQFMAHRDPYTGRFVYSFEGADLRTAVWKAILAIPHAEDEAAGYDPAFRQRGMQFRPSYSEFYLTRMEPNLPRALLLLKYIGGLLAGKPEKPLQPLFIEHSVQPAFRPITKDSIEDMEASNLALIRRPASSTDR